MHRHAEGAVLEEVPQQVERVHSPHPHATLVAAAIAAVAAVAAALVGALLAALAVVWRGALEQRRHGVAQHRIWPAIEPLVRVRVRG